MSDLGGVSAVAKLHMAIGAKPMWALLSIFGAPVPTGLSATGAAREAVEFFEEDRRGR